MLWEFRKWGLLSRNCGWVGVRVIVRVSVEIGWRVGKLGLLNVVSKE